MKFKKFTIKVENPKKRRQRLPAPKTFKDKSKYDRKKDKAMSFNDYVEYILEGFESEKKKGLKGWFDRNKGKGWVDCKTGKTCGRQEGEKRRSYPACRPTKAMCNSRKRYKKSSKRISWEKGKKKS